MATTGKPEKSPINLLRGWPAPSLLPTAAIQASATAVLADPAKAQPALLYGADQGYPPLRNAISEWLGDFYGGGAADAERICITGGASQNLACILQVFADPGSTRNVWMVAPTYFLACRVFIDNGFGGRLRAVPEDEEGIDIDYLEEKIREADGAEWTATVSRDSIFQFPSCLLDQFECYEYYLFVSCMNTPSLVLSTCWLIPSQPLKPVRPWSKHYRHIIYAVPTFANPSGRTMSLARRQQLVALARRHDALLVTDDVYDFLQWRTSGDEHAPPLTKAVLPRLVDVDQTMPPAPDADGFGNAVSNGSFSKIVGPGVRTGWAEAAPRLAFGLSQTGSSRSGGAPSQLAATFVAEYLASGELQRAIETTLIPAYASRYRAMMRAVEKYLLPLGIKVAKVDHEGIAGGYFIWLNLSDGLDAPAVADEALETDQLIVGSGEIFVVQGDELAVNLSRGIRLCFAWEDEDKQVEGVIRLSKVMTMMMDRSRHPQRTGDQ